MNFKAQEVNEEAATYAMCSNDAVRKSNLRNAQAMANVLGRSVTSSDGQTAYPKAVGDVK
jgi:hypothetical protein